MADDSDMWRARVELIERQRRLDWELAIDEGRAAGIKVGRNHAHDLRNMVQVLELGLLALDRHGAAATPDARELLAELRTTVNEGKATIAELTGTAPPAAGDARVPGAPIADAVRAALAQIRPALPPAIEVVEHVAVDPSVCTDCAATAIDHLLGHALLDMPSVARGAGKLAVTVRERRIEGRRWVELLCEDSAPGGDEGAPPDVVGLLVSRAGGEVSVSATRTGGTELVIAFPAC